MKAMKRTIGTKKIITPVPRVKTTSMKGKVAKAPKGTKKTSMKGRKTKTVVDLPKMEITTKVWYAIGDDGWRLVGLDWARDQVVEIWGRPRIKQAPKPMK